MARNHNTASAKVDIGELEPFVYALSNATTALGLVIEGIEAGSNGPTNFAAAHWLAGYAAERAEELRAVCAGEKPAFNTTMHERDRHIVLARLPARQEAGA